MDEFPLERVAAITGCDPEGIAAAARLYATSAPGVIPWTPITDQQRNSTSAIRLHCALRVLTGSRDAPGGELMHGFHRDIVPESTLELHEALPAGQKAKQLGADTHPAFTYRGMETLGEPARRVWGHEYPNLVSGCYMANPTATFRAMATGEPYPVKAFFTLGNNTLMGFANMQCIRRRRLAHGEAAGRPRRRGGALPGARVSRRFGWGEGRRGVAPGGWCVESRHPRTGRACTLTSRDLIATARGLAGITSKVWCEREDSPGWPLVHFLPRSSLGRRDPAAV